MTDQYKKGRRFEWAVRDELEEAGYQVIRSAGSKTKVDIVAWKMGELLFIQCKATKAGLPVVDWNNLIDLASMIPGTIPVLAIKTDGVAKPGYMRLTRRRVMRSIPLCSVHYERWSPDQVGDSHAE